MPFNFNYTKYLFFQLCQPDMNCHRYEVRDNDLTSFYEQDWLSQNLRTVIHNLIFVHEIPEQEENGKFFKADEDLETTETQVSIALYFFITFSS